MTHSRLSGACRAPDRRQATSQSDTTDRDLSSCTLPATPTDEYGAGSTGLTRTGRAVVLYPRCELPEAIGDFPEWCISARQRSDNSVNLNEPVLNRVGVDRFALQDPTCQLPHSIVVLVGRRSDAQQPGWVGPIYESLDLCRDFLVQVTQVLGSVIHRLEGSGSSSARSPTPYRSLPLQRNLRGAHSASAFRPLSRRALREDGGVADPQYVYILWHGDDLGEGSPEASFWVSIQPRQPRRTESAVVSERAWLASLSTPTTSSSTVTRSTRIIGSRAISRLTSGLVSSAPRADSVAIVWQCLDDQREREREHPALWSCGLVRLMDADLGAVNAADAYLGAPWFCSVLTRPFCWLTLTSV